jgi:hypothetical protein
MKLHFPFDLLVVRIKLRNIRHKSAARLVKPLEELPRDKEQLLRNQLRIGDELQVFLLYPQPVDVRPPIFSVSSLHLPHIKQILLTKQYNRSSPSS